MAKHTQPNLLQLQQLGWTRIYLLLMEEKKNFVDGVYPKQKNITPFNHLPDNH